MGMALVGVLVGGYLLVREVTSDNGPAATFVPGSPTPSPGPYPALADGQYIDSLPSDIPTIPNPFSALPMPYAASRAPAIAMVEITGTVETIVPTPEPGTVVPTGDRDRATPWTIHSANVVQWIKGGKGETEITISTIGGLDYDGARFFTGTFLAQTGRTYIMILDNALENSPGYPNIDYIGVFAGWSAFEVGDGVIHVLNQRTARELMGAWNLTPVDKFIGLLEDWIEQPPAITPTPPPSPTPSPSRS